MKEKEYSPEFKKWVDVLIHVLKNYIKKSKERVPKQHKNKQERQEKTRNKWWEQKQLYGYFKEQTSKIVHGKTWTWLIKRNLSRGTESLLITAQN